jgi:hypothetical protein
VQLKCVSDLLGRRSAAALGINQSALPSSMLVKCALKSHRSTCHGILKAGNGTVMALTCCRLASLLAVVLNQGLQFATASIQGASKIQGNIG